MKDYRLLLWARVGALVFLSMAVFLAYIWKEARSSLQETRLFPDWGSVRQLVFHSADGSHVELTHSEGGFLVQEGTQSFPADGLLVEQFLNNLQDLMVLQIVETGRENLGDYGTVDSLQLTVISSDAQEYTVFLGNTSSARRYVLFEDTIYLTKDIFSFALSGNNSQHWVNKALFSTQEQETPLVLLSLDKQEVDEEAVSYSVDFVLLPSEEKEVAWQAIFEGQEISLSDSRSLQTSVGQLLALKAERVFYREGSEPVIGHMRLEWNDGRAQTWIIGHAENDPGFSSYLFWKTEEALTYSVPDWRIKSIWRDPQYWGLTDAD